MPTQLASSTSFSRLLVTSSLRPFIRDLDPEDLYLTGSRYVKLFLLIAASAYGIATLALVTMFFVWVIRLGWRPSARGPFLFLASPYLIPTAAISLGIWVVAAVFLRVVADLVATRPKRAEETASVFEKNLKDNFVVQSFELQHVRFFENGFYRFAPRVNVLLGRNGYAKTLLFRTLVALLQRDDERSQQMFEPESSRLSKSDEAARAPLLTIEVVRNGATELIRRVATYFDGLVGKIPVLAIPDSRFVNRSNQKMQFSSTSSEWFARSGAQHFLSQEPHDSEIQRLLSQLCVEYLKQHSWPTGRGFERPIFRMIQEVVRELTEDQEFAFDTIRDSGRSGFEILVRSAGSHGNPLPNSVCLPRNLVRFGYIWTDL
jgi:hypothetical protein